MYINKGPYDRGWGQSESDVIPTVCVWGFWKVPPAVQIRAQAEEPRTASCRNGLVPRMLYSTAYGEVSQRSESFDAAPLGKRETGRGSGSSSSSSCSSRSSLRSRRRARREGVEGGTGSWCSTTTMKKSLCSVLTPCRRTSELSPTLDRTITATTPVYHVPVVASLTSPPYAFLQVQRQILMRAEEGSIVTTNAENPSKTSVSAMNNSPYWSVSCSTEMR
ncbi:uncharacterized protein [Physcomitrium patens]|uniref:uncharacterized protein n=1 Tax=Physcomitrium patens TaxID=3218 RepID=UPI003CCCEF95